MIAETWSEVVRWSAHPGLGTAAAAFLLFAVLLWPAERLWPACPGQRVRRPGLRTDLLFWAFSPLVGKALAYAGVAALAGWAMAGLGRPVDLTGTTGWGPVGRQPLWLQAVEAFILADFVFYWVHRGFHRSRLWPFHAVHHSGERMDWVSAMRFHPVNEAASRACQAAPLVLLGFAPAAVLCAVPVVVAFIVVNHANIRWTWGPFGRVLVSPAYHHWHHSSDPEAIDKNFAGALVIWDRLFGTYYHPPGKRPARFGVAGARPPGGVVGLLAWPFAAVLGLDRRAGSGGTDRTGESEGCADTAGGRPCRATR